MSRKRKGWSGPLTRKGVIAAHKRVAKQAVRTVAQRTVAKMEAYAKQNRQWQDRTGNARQGLHGWIEDHPKFIRAYISHGVDYGEDLETRNHGSLGIINETLEANADEAMQDLKKIFSRKGGGNDVPF